MLFFSEIITETSRLLHPLNDKSHTLFLEILKLMNLSIGSPIIITFRLPNSPNERSGSVSMFSIELRKAEMKHS